MARPPELLSKTHPREDPRLIATSRLFRILGDPTRLRILELLLEGGKTVTELVENIGSPQGRVSSHLACLRWCGFISTQRDGKHVFYRVTDQRVRQMLTLARALLADNAQAVLSCTRIDSHGPS